MHFLELIKISFLRELTSESHFTMSNLMKRKRVVISVQEKLTAIKRLNKGVSLRSVAKNYCVGISTVSEWRKYRKKKIEQWCSAAFLKVCSAEPQGSAKDAQGLRSRRLVPMASQSPKIYPLKSTKN
jgi:hypothetical protein